MSTGDAQSQILDADLDRKAYRTLLGLADRLADFGGTEAADAETAKADALVARWPETQRADLLAPLLQDAEQPSVRLHAATGLLDVGRQDLAVPVLKALAKGKGDASGRATAALEEIQPGAGTPDNAQPDRTSPTT